MLDGRAISQQIKAANGLLAALLRRREDDDMMLQIGRVRTKKQAEAEAKGRPRGRVGAWGMRPDFTIPLPNPGRPRAADGVTTTFHFHGSSVTRMSSSGTAGPASAANHAIYVERAEAVEVGSAITHAGYVERPDAIEMAGSPLVFSNISEDAALRLDYWQAVDRCERQARPSLQLAVNAPTGWWRKAEADLPAEFCAHCNAEEERKAAHFLIPVGKRKTFRPKPFKSDLEVGEAILKAVVNVPGWSVEHPPLTFKPGLSGRTQYRYVAELPHELGPEDRAAIVRAFCDYLGSFACDSQGNPQGMMYTAAIHAPDAGNDKRNYHVHVIAHDRPAQWLAEHGAWDFEVTETFKRKGESRTRHPHRRDKIVEVTRSLAPDKQPPFYQAEIAGHAFLPHLREKFAAICNTRLEARGIDRRIDARSHEALGIDKQPELHLGTRAAALERAGVPTWAGRYNAATSWVHEAIADRGRVGAFADRWRQEQDALGRSVGKSREGAGLVQERVEVLDAIHTATELFWESDRLRRQALSRAQATRDHCGGLLARKGGGAAHRASVEKRRREAEEHIARVTAALAAGEAEIQAAVTALGELHLRRIAIDDKIETLGREIARHKSLSCLAELQFAIEAGPGTTQKRQPLSSVGTLSHVGSVSGIGLVESGAGMFRIADRTGVPTSTGQEKQSTVLRDDSGIQPSPMQLRGPSPAQRAEPVSVEVCETATVRPDRSSAPLPEPTERSAGTPDAAVPDGRSIVLTVPAPAHVRPPADRAALDLLDERGLIDALLNRIASERIRIVLTSGKPSVELTSERERKLLASRPFQELIGRRLTRIAERQAKEVGRLIAWIEKHGSVPNRSSSPDAPQTLWTHWQNHLDVQRAVQAASESQGTLGSIDVPSTPAALSRIEILKGLEQIRFLPLRPEQPQRGDSSRALLVLVPDTAFAADAALIAQASLIQGDADMQALLQSKFASFLEHVRITMTTSRMDKPPGGPLGWIAGGDPRLRAALTAAKDSDPLGKVIAEAQRSRAERDDGLDIVGFAHAKGGQGRN